MTTGPRSRTPLGGRMNRGLGGGLTLSGLGGFGAFAAFGAFSAFGALSAFGGFSAFGAFSFFSSLRGFSFFCGIGGASTAARAVGRVEASGGSGGGASRVGVSGGRRRLQGGGALGQGLLLLLPPAGRRGDEPQRDQARIDFFGHLATRGGRIRGLDCAKCRRVGSRPRECETGLSKRMWHSYGLDGTKRSPARSRRGLWAVRWRPERSSTSSRWRGRSSFHRRWPRPRGPGGVGRGGRPPRRSRARARRPR